MTVIAYSTRAYTAPNGTEEWGGVDWSLQRRMATDAIHVMGCIGWIECVGNPGRYLHLCRSHVGNVLAMLHTQGQLIPDDFRDPRFT